MLDLRPFCNLEIRLAIPLELGASLRGRRRVIPITGGRVLGPRLQGAVLPGGDDWQTVYEDGTRSSRRATPCGSTIAP